MAITVRSGAPASAVTTALGAGQGPSVTLNGTKQPQAGDKLIIVHLNDWYTLSTLQTPTVGGSTTGVTAISAATADAGTNGCHAKSWTYDVASTGDLTVAAATTNGDEEQGLIVWVLAGAGLVDDADSAFSVSSQTSQALPSVDATTATDFLIAAAVGARGVQDATMAYTPPSGMAEQLDQRDAGNWAVLTAADQTLSASGATGTRTFTSSANNAWAGVIVAIQPASASSPDPAVLRVVRSNIRL